MNAPQALAVLTASSIRRHDMLGHIDRWGHNALFAATALLTIAVVVYSN